MGELSFKFREEDCIKMILEFLENRDLNISQLSLERETGVTNGHFSDDLLFLRQLILDGQWEHVFEFIQPLESISTFDKKQVRYILNKYKYIELLCIKFEIGPFQNAENCVKKIVDCLSELESYCPSKEDYNNFCLLLTLENFGQSSDYKNWNPSLSRIKCFNELLKHIEKFLPVIKKPDNKLNECSKGDRLMQIIIKGLIYESCLEYCQNRAISGVDANVNFEFSNILEVTKLHRSDSSLLSWLQAIPPDTFNFQFEDKKLNVNIEKLDKPSLIATWSEIMLASPIKPRVFPHFATPFTRLKATDLMSKSLTSGIVDGLSRSLMNFSLKDAVDMSHSTIGTNEFHLSQSDKRPPLPIDLLTPCKKDSDEKQMEKMFEHGNVFNSSLFGKLSTIAEDKIVNDVFKQSPANNVTNNVTNCVTHVINNTTNALSDHTSSTVKSSDNQSIEEVKIQLEQFADAQWRAFLKKKDELMMASVNKSMIADPNVKHTVDQLTPVNQVGQHNFKDLDALKFTSTPKATPIQLEIAPVDYNPVRLNFSGISADSHSNTMTTDTELNHTTKLAANHFDMISPKNPLNSRHLVNETQRMRLSNKLQKINRTILLKADSLAWPPKLSRLNNSMWALHYYCRHPGSNNSSLKSPNISLDSGVVAKSNSSVHLNGNQGVNNGSKLDDKSGIQLMKKDLNKGLFVELTKLEDVQAIRSIEFHPQGRYYAIGSNSKTLRICTYPYSNEIKKDCVDLPIQSDVTFRRLKYHKGSIFCLGWNPSGELLATGSNDQTIKLVRFNQESCELYEDSETVLQMHEATVRDLCFMQDSTNNTNLLISGGAGNCKIYITDCQTATPFQAFSGHSGHVLSLYNWGGAVFVSGSQDRTIRFWDLRSQGCVNLITAPSVTGQGAGGAVSSVTVDPSGRLLVSGHDDASCMLYDIRGQRVIQTFKPHNGDIRSVRFSPKAYYLLSGGYDNNIVLTDLQGDLTQPLTSLVVATHQDKVVQAKWHPTEFNFLSSSADKTAVLWSLPSN